jgi:phage terminase small subunit
MCTMANELASKLRAKKPEPAQSKVLSSQQKAFVQAVAKGDSVAAASLRAGYAHKTSGYELMKVPAIANAVVTEKAKFEADAQMDRKQVMEGFKEAIEMAKLMADPQAMIAGWREVGKMCGYYAPIETKLKVDITGNVTMTRLTQMSDAELLELIEKGANGNQPQLTDAS